MATPDCVVLATMHGKETAIAPLLRRALGWQCHVPAGFDTDRFGTFSRDIARLGAPIDTARAKIAAAFESVPQASLGIASEGSFGPHPQIPFLAVDREIVVLVDRRNGLEVVGHHLSPRTNFAQALVSDATAAIAFARAVGFPEHGVIVIGTRAGKPAPDRLLCKNIQHMSDLLAAVRAAIALGDPAHLETDMRASHNPTRMRVIKRATVNLLRRYCSRCPRCQRAGFVVTEVLTGLPCALCAEPTDTPRAEVMACAGCAYRVEKPFDALVADPGRCDNCNP
ncbi:hypothetical protein PY254_03245 [Rhodanobacter sp. AS-Z3]|uniref:DUF6671 family protein n=1 Tax=Rhodanobacter sp. AS-Z3 TaxID=3031330 RepID=UPI0024794B2B|nr:DUF6671 family protein [Rhodanobacter sp. AS-Z3]WEN15704.1 hypothetical protein PY254_03245 [Rhodanobacter sp. AS-Z3]